MKYAISALLFTTLAVAQAPVDPAVQAQKAEQQEQTELNQVMMDAGNSPIDLVHAIEGFLQRHPATKERASLEKSLAQNAIQLNDNARLLLYGEKVLAREKTDDPTLLDRVIRALDDTEDAERAQRAAVLSKRYEKAILNLRTQPPPGHLTPIQWRDELDRADARALVLESRALGNQGDQAGAAQTALRSWQACPTADGAREAAHWFMKLGQTASAVEYFADAFTLEDTRTTAADRTLDRTRLGELYRELNGSEKGLGDLILAAYDRTAALMADRRAMFQKADPNIEVTKIMDFRLPGLDGAAPLSMASLKGKTIVLDFWATWCAPCRAEMPQLDSIYTHFQSQDLVVLSITNEEPFKVNQFIAPTSYHPPVLIDTGGAVHKQFHIEGIPRTFVFNREGKLVAEAIDQRTMRQFLLMLSKTDLHP